MKTEKLRQLVHLTAGVILLVVGYNFFDASDYLFATCFFCVALIILIVAGLDEWIAKTFTHADSIFYFLEAAVITFRAGLYLTGGHFWLFSVMAFIGVCLFVFAISSLPARKKERHSSGKKRKRHSSSTLKKRKQVNDGIDMQGAF